MKVKPNILIVDDDVKLCESLKMILDETGEWQALTASNSAEALRLFREEGVNIVLLDLILKNDKNGVQIYKEMKGIKPAVKAILFTGHGPQEERGLLLDAAREGIIDELLRKPIWPDELIDALGKYKNN